MSLSCCRATRNSEWSGSGTSLLAAANLERRAYGFELKREYVKAFYEKILPCEQTDMFIQDEKNQKDFEKKQRCLMFEKEGD